jgi:hypothetical protein
MALALLGYLFEVQQQLKHHLAEHHPICISVSLRATAVCTMWSAALLKYGWGATPSHENLSAFPLYELSIRFLDYTTQAPTDKLLLYLRIILLKIQNHACTSLHSSAYRDMRCESRARIQIDRHILPIDNTSNKRYL